MNKGKKIDYFEQKRVTEESFAESFMDDLDKRCNMMGGGELVNRDGFEFTAEVLSRLLWRIMELEKEVRILKGEERCN